MVKVVVVEGSVLLAMVVLGVVVITVVGGSGNGFQHGESSAWISSSWNHRSFEWATFNVQSADDVVTSKMAKKAVTKHRTVAMRWKLLSPLCSGSRLQRNSN